MAIHHTAHIAAVALVLFVVLDRAYMAFVAKKYNPATWRKAALALAAVGALWLALRRDTWLPFLGEAALPPSTLLVASPTFADASLVVKAPPRAIRCVYWTAANAADTVAPDPRSAYGKFENGGVAMVIDGQASLRFRKPGAYRVWGRTKAPHVHYRFVFDDGMAGPIVTTTTAA